MYLTKQTNKKKQAKNKGFSKLFSHLVGLNVS